MDGWDTWIRGGADLVLLGTIVVQAMPRILEGSHGI